MKGLGVMLARLGERRLGKERASTTLPIPLIRIVTPSELNDF
jgi:hypothetical protein